MKQFVKNFNILVKRTIFKVENKTNDKLKISSFNKILITFISLLFLYIFYLLIPTIYDKDWVKDNIKTKLFKEFKLNLNSFENISYRILPAPHFLIKDTNLLSNNPSNKKSIAEIRVLKIFLNQLNFLNKEKMAIKKVIISNANFSLLRNDLKELNNSTNHKFSHNEIKVKESNIYFKDNLDEIITIIKVNEANFFFDNERLENQFNLKGNIFAIPFTFEMKTKNDLTIVKKFLFKAKSLSLDIFNSSIKKKDNSTIGNNIIYFLRSKIDTEYKLIDESIIFKSKDPRLKNYKLKYDGEISINPFDLDLNISLNNNKISKLFNLNPTLIEFFKSGLLFNNNISLNTSVIINSNTGENFFDDAEIYFNIFNGKINFDNTKLINKKIGSLKLSDSNLFLDNNKLVLNTNLFFNISNSANLFSFLNTKKKSRKEIKNALVNIDYDFSNNEIKFNKIKIDKNELNNREMLILEGFNDNDSNNLIKTRRILNEFFNAYAG